MLSQIERNHLSIVGPKHIGKSVLLCAVAEHYRQGGGPFRSSLYWDLRHSTPANDEEFYVQFAGKLAATVRGIYAEYAVELEKPDSANYRGIQTILELLRDEGVAILFCLDGWDRLLVDSDVTRNLLDNLRALAEWPTVRLVTGSRRRLRELCATREARTSDFHNIFGNPLTLAALPEAEIDSFLAPFAGRGVTFGVGAKKEVYNWTGGIPVLLACVCRDLWDAAADGAAIPKDQVDAIGARLHAQEQDTIQELWEDCSEEQRAFTARVHAGEISEADGRGGRLIASLVDRGFLGQDGRRIDLICRSLRDFLAQGAGGLANVLHSLFGTPVAFVGNTKALLQLRFSTLTEMDDELADYLRNAIANVDKAHLMIRYVRALVERSFNLIWDRTIPDRRIPAEWSDEWKQPDRDGNVVYNPPEGQVAGRLGKQCQLLNLMTDPRRTRRTTIRRSTYVLIEGLQTAGDFGQHLEGEVVPPGFGLAVCLSALQVAEQLTEDLKVH